MFLQTEAVNGELPARLPGNKADNQIIAVVNLDPHNPHAGWIELDLPGLGIDAGAKYQMHDLLSGERFLWQGARNFVRLDPARSPAHVFRLLRRVHREQDFDYFA